MTVRYCLRCRQDVANDGYNPSYNGNAIHYGYDWYCGPVIECDELPDKKTVQRLWKNYQARWLYDWKKRHGLLRKRGARL